ncbi:hypothetical protein B0I35DRAFT_357121 [Stachybotrys elegans]|uniref:ABM domain-containing protein n=1 Tax=Stachybotrys elegans TaxID=80388 RepID=A0A8K0SJ87_9HYPO|nr:hypothetical protein B0I35DRAFT_357121 [Stachybotrys elegans]
MARAKTIRIRERGPITWTRFHLPREQEWPTWSVSHPDVHVGPLADVQGAMFIRLGRMVEHPEQAAYIISWDTLDDLKNFQSSPVCAEFLQNLPRNDISQVSIESGSALSSLSLEDSSMSPPSRFLTLSYVDSRPTSKLEGRITLSAFMIPRTYNPSINDLRNGPGRFFPPGSEYIQYERWLRWEQKIVWFSVIAEDSWVEEKFGELAKNQDRKIFCELRVWPNPNDYNASSEPGAECEEASAKDPQTRALWNQAVAKVMPPVTSWEQERWDIREVPRFYPPAELSQEDMEYEREMEEWRKEYYQEHE